MNSRSPALVIALALAACPAPVHACSQCLCGTPFPADALGGVTPLQLRYGIEDRYLSKENALEDEPGIEAEREHRVGAYVVWRAMDRLALLGRLPYNFKEITETPEGEAGITEHEQGLGDAELLALVGIAHGAGMNPGVLGAVIGVMAPTGPNDRHDEFGEREDEHLQPGTGAWSGTLGLNATLPVSGGTFDSGILGRVNGENSHGYHYGNTLLYNAGFITKGYHGWSGIAQMNGRTASEDDLGGGEKGEHTGGTVLYMSPGVRWLGPRGVSLDALVQFPVVESLHGIQDEHTTARLSLSMNH
jgi:hypothetical protein